MPQIGNLRKAAIAAVAIGTWSTIAACGESNNPADPAGGNGSGNKTIVFSPGSTKVPALRALANGVKAYGESHGYKVIIQDADNNPQTQITQLQSAIGNGQAAGVYANMLDPRSAGPLIQAAQKAGVPVLTTGLPSDYGLSGLVPGVSFTETDYEATGKAVGTELGTCIKEKLGGKAEIIQEVNGPGIPGAAETEAAMKAALAATAPEAKIVTRVQVTVDQGKAQRDIGSALQGHPNAKAVIGVLDEGALGALGAYAAAGKDLPCVVSSGGSAQAEAAVKSGKIYAIVKLDFQRDLVQSMDALINMLKDPKSTGKQFTVPQQVIRAGK